MEITRISTRQPVRVGDRHDKTHGTQEGVSMRKSVLAVLLSAAVPVVAGAGEFSLVPMSAREITAGSQSVMVNETPAASDPVYLAPSSGQRFGHQGTWDFALSGSGSNDAEFENGSFGVNFVIGYFFADGWEVAARQTANFSSGGDDTWNASTRVALDYHFDLDRFQPYIGVNGGYVYGDSVNDTWAAGPEAGVKYFIKDEAYIFAQIEYQFFFRDAGDADDNFDDGQFVYTLGVGFTF